MGESKKETYNAQYIPDYYLLKFEAMDLGMLVHWHSKCRRHIFWSNFH